MGIMEQMRSGSDSTAMQVLLAVIVVSFIGWYAKPQGDRTSIVAEVDGTWIMATELNRAYRSELRRVEAQAGRTLSNAEQQQLQESVKQRLIEDEVVLQEARRIGLEVSDSEVARLLLKHTGLLNAEGRFDDELYKRFLKRQRLSRSKYEESLREDLLRTKLRILAYTGASISEPALLDAWKESETRLDVKSVRVRASAFNDHVVITDEDRAAWLAENAEQVKAVYDQDFERLYRHPEQVRMRMIRLAVVEGGPSVVDLLPKLNKLRAEIEAGADFAEMAKRWSEDPTAFEGGELGLRPVVQLSQQALSAIKDVPVGAMSRVVTLENDIRLFMVEERVAPVVDSLESVQNEIADRLIRQERTPAMAAAFAEDELLVQWTESGEPPEELLKEHGLTAMSSGPIPPISTSPFAPPQPLLDDALKAEPGAVLPEVYENQGTLWVAQLVSRADPDLERFETAKEQIREGVLAQRRSVFYDAWVAELKSQAKIR